MQVSAFKLVCDEKCPLGGAKSSPPQGLETGPEGKQSGALGLPENDNILF